MRDRLRTAACMLAMCLLASAGSAQLAPQPAYQEPSAAQPPAPPPAPAPAPGAYPVYAPAPQPTVVVQQAAPAPVAELVEPEPPPPAGGDDENWGTPSDHDRVVGRVAVGWMGVLGVPIGPAGSAETVSAPAVGVRYWLNDGVGIEGGLGFGLTTTGGTAFMPTGDTELPGTGQFGMVLHGGVPISIWDVGHYNGLVMPELNFGFSSGLDEGASVDSALDDTIFSGLLFNLGLRAGAEIHLEAIDIPQATLQLTFGVGINFEIRGDEDDSGNFGTDTGRFVLKTSALDFTDLLASGVQIFFYL